MSTPCRIAIHGHTGKLGSLILEHAAAPTPRDSAVPDCDVVIDVSSADGLRALPSNYLDKRC